MERWLRPLHMLDARMTEENTIKLFHSDEKVFVWNADDAAYLRDELRIVGNLVGCLPRCPRQNAYLGLPLQLMPEEVTLLLQKGLARLVESKPLAAPSQQSIQEYEEFCEDSYKQQVELFKEERKKEIKQNLLKIIEGKKEKRRQEIGEKMEGLDEEALEREITEEIERKPIPPIAKKNTLVQLFTESPWKDQSVDVTDDWKFPTSVIENVRCRVYRDLWEQGKYLTSGTKFGGDFLVYPGDPARFHSHYIAICVPHQKKMTALDLVAMGRLGSNVRKTVVICSIDDQNKICYTSLQWTGIS